MRQRPPMERWLIRQIAGAGQDGVSIRELAARRLTEMAGGAVDRSRHRPLESVIHGTLGRLRSQSIIRSNGGGKHRAIWSSSLEMYYPTRRARKMAAADAE